MENNIEICPEIVNNNIELKKLTFFEQKFILNKCGLTETQIFICENIFKGKLHKEIIDLSKKSDSSYYDELRKIKNKIIRAIKQFNSSIRYMP